MREMCLQIGVARRNRSLHALSVLDALMDNSSLEGVAMVFGGCGDREKDEGDAWDLRV